jgi:hypothetical protein
MMDVELQIECPQKHLVVSKVEDSNMPISPTFLSGYWQIEGVPKAIVGEMRDKRR